MPKCSFKVKKNRFRQIAKNTAVNVQRAVNKTAKMIERTAKRHVAIDTGALKASIYTVTPTKSGYAEARAASANKSIAADIKAAQGKRSHPDLSVEFLPEIKRAQAYEAFVAVCLGYGVYIEYGTNKAPAQPFFIPSFETHRQDFKEALREALQKAVKPR